MQKDEQHRPHQKHNGLQHSMLVWLYKTQDEDKQDKKHNTEKKKKKNRKHNTEY